MHPSGDGTPTPCPFCGCRHHIEDAVAGSPGTHITHRCLRCGRQFEDSGPACPRCGSPGELLGDVDAPGHGLYAQYRCCGCGHGFMVRMTGGEEIRKT
jgi:DNA-directed RNA polymerase subunit RPC12/RpoP